VSKKDSYLSSNRSKSSNDPTPSFIPGSSPGQALPRVAGEERGGGLEQLERFEPRLGCQLHFCSRAATISFASLSTGVMSVNSWRATSKYFRPSTNRFSAGSISLGISIRRELGGSSP
jgi:hypothetical protein